MVLFPLQLLFIVPIFVSAQITTNPIIICMPEQCLQGISNIAFGAKLSSPETPFPIHLVPGRYTLTTNPLLLHKSLSSDSASLTSSAGLPDTFSLPLDLSLQPGLAIFSEHLYSGQTSFSPLPNSPLDSNFSIPLTAKSFALSSDVVAIVNSSSTDRIILWDSIPDVRQLPLSVSEISLVDIQSAACTPACSSAGTCRPDGKCACLDGFAGSLCEDCAPRHFGPKCQKCDDLCKNCDEGIPGTGRCLKRNQNQNQTVEENTRDLVNGICGSDGQCNCKDGFVRADNGTQCAKCTDGFFETPSGDCKVCGLGCDGCSASADACIACKPGFARDPNDGTKCSIAKQLVPSTNQPCPERTFASGLTCSACDQSCGSCSGGTANNCTSCAHGLYMGPQGVCIRTNGDGICEGTNLIADTIKRACDSCGDKCMACKYPSFTDNSTISDLQCTSCIPGTFLFDGKCVDGCPIGSFVSPRNNNTCLPCRSGCKTCSGSAACLTCPVLDQVVVNGTCVDSSSCPQNTYASPSTSTCLPCHRDCATCSGPKFNECTSCPSSRPILNSGRCVSTCAKEEYWDRQAAKCRPCDDSCGSCFGPEPSSCLSCSNANDRVLRSGSCVLSSGICEFNTSVINPLGACFSELMTVISPPKASETASSTPVPSGTTSHASASTATGPDPSAAAIKNLKPVWWQILLMVLGGVFVLLVCIWCGRRCMRKRRERRRHLQARAFADMCSTYHARSWEKPEGQDEVQYGYNSGPGEGSYVRGGPVTALPSRISDPRSVEQGQTSHIEAGMDEDREKILEFISLYRQTLGPQSLRAINPEVSRPSSYSGDDEDSSSYKKARHLVRFDVDQSGDDYNR